MLELILIIKTKREITMYDDVALFIAAVQKTVMQSDIVVMVYEDPRRDLQLLLFFHLQKTIKKQRSHWLRLV